MLFCHGLDQQGNTIKAVYALNSTDQLGNKIKSICNTKYTKIKWCERLITDYTYIVNLDSFGYMIIKVYVKVTCDIYMYKVISYTTTNNLNGI